MKLTDKFTDGRTLFAFELLPPLKGQNIESIYSAIDTLREFSPSYINVTYHREEIKLVEREGGLLERRVVRKRPGTVGISAAIQARYSIDVVPHLICGGFSADETEDALIEMNFLGIDNVLALRGDAPRGVSDWDWNAGHFHNARDLVRFLRSEHPDLGIGVAGYPAPHPDAATFASDRAYLADKLRAAGLETPVIPGILPIQSFDSLRRVLSLCGANIPGKLYLELEAAHNEGGVEAVREAGLRFAARQIRQLLDCGAPGIHLYSLNKSEMCLRLVEEAGL